MNAWEAIREHLPSFGTGRDTPVLSTVDRSGWPVSTRCRAREDGTGSDRRFLLWLPAEMPAMSGPAVLLWHRHDEKFGQTAALSVAGEVRLDERPAVFRVIRLAAVVNLRRNHSPGGFARMERAAGEYLQAHGLAPPEFQWTDFDGIVQALDSDNQGSLR